MQSSLNSKCKSEILLLQQKMASFSPLTFLFFEKLRPFLLSAYVDGDPMDVSRKCVEVDTDIRKNDRGIWPNGFLQL